MAAMLQLGPVGLPRKRRLICSSSLWRAVQGIPRTEQPPPSRQKSKPQQLRAMLKGKSPIWPAINTRIPQGHRLPTWTVLPLLLVRKIPGTYLCSCLVNFEV